MNSYGKFLQDFGTKQQSHLFLMLSIPEDLSLSLIPCNGQSTGLHLYILEQPAESCSNSQDQLQFCLI